MVNALLYIMSDFLTNLKYKKFINLVQVAGSEFEVDSAQDTNDFYMANGNILDGVNKVSLAKDKIFIRFF